MLIHILMENKAIDQEKLYSALLTNLLKDFDCLPHNLAFAKLHA